MNKYLLVLISVMLTALIASFGWLMFMDHVLYERLMKTFM